MAFAVGYGGSATLLSIFGNRTLCTGKWTLNRAARLKNTADASTMGADAWCVEGRGCNGTVELPFDDAVILETLQVYEGQTVYLRLKVGSSSKTIDVYACIETVAYAVDNAQGAVMMVLTWKGQGVPTAPK